MPRLSAVLSRLAATRPWLRLTAGALALGWLAASSSTPLSGAPAPMGPDTLEWSVIPEAQAPPAGQVAAEARSADNVWQFLAARPAADAARTVNGQYAVVNFSKAAFDAQLAVVARDTDPAAAGVLFTMPFPDGTFERFIVKDSPMLAPELQATFPDFRQFSGQGVDDPTATTRFGWTSAGFHAIVLSSVRGTVFIDTWAPGDTTTHMVYRKGDLQRADGETWQCLVEGQHNEAHHRDQDFFPMTHGETLRTYVLAIAASGEYTAIAPAVGEFAQGSKGAALDRMTKTVNRVSGIYERDLAVKFTLKTGTTASPLLLIQDNAATDPYQNTGDSAELNRNQAHFDTVMTGDGSSYDIGHLFNTSGGGIALLQSPCTASKARGLTGSPNPTDDAFDVDYVAHEIGHQFGGNHTFNGSTSSCSSTSHRPAHAYEVGSGVTIQAYAGICGVENLQSNSIDRFHAESLDEMTAFITNAATGDSCGVDTATSNTPPVVAALNAVTIPASTPFALTASATDTVGQSLTYSWDQFDQGTNTGTSGVAAASNGAQTTGPLFRPYSQTSSPTRRFPSDPYILNNANVPPTTYTGTAFPGGPSCGGDTCLTGEVLPTETRTMDFMVVVRDNRSGGGAIATQTQRVNVVKTSGPFRVTAPNTNVSITGNTQTTVTWDVAGTTGNGIDTANVTIMLSTDGGQTYSSLLNSTPNDGSQAVTIPNTPTSTARILVQGAGNVFFDVSDVNFTITAGSGGAGVGAWTLDTAFVGGANGVVRSIAVQADSKILVGGEFTMLGGGGTGTTIRRYGGRFGADGSLDATFDPAPNGPIHSLLVQSDEKILVGGTFTRIGTDNGTIRGIARLNANGTNDFNFSNHQLISSGGGVFAIGVQPDLDIVIGGLFDSVGLPRRNVARLARARGDADVSFNPGANDEVNTIVVQADGKILVGGGFTRLGGGSTGLRNYLGRLHTDGSIDTDFNPSPDLHVRSVALQGDGKIIVGGWFATIAGVARPKLARLNADGSLDTSFAPAVIGDVEVVRVLSDGRIVVGGYMTVGSPGSTQRQFATLLNPDGSIDAGFNPGLNGGVTAVGLQADGKILLGGEFTMVGEGATASNRRHLIRLVPPTLAVTPTITGTPSTLRFAATKNGAGGDLVASTGAQSVTVTYTGSTAPQWTATSSQPWAVVSNGTGTGAGTFSVSIANPSNVIAGSTNLTATITLAAANTSTSTTIAVQLTVTQQTGTTTGPTGQVDTPAQSATGLQGAIAMTGWVVDDVGIQHVRIYRQCLTGIDNPAACQDVLGSSVVFVGTASIISGARPDVEALFPSLPANNSAGWGFLILSNLLPNIPASNASGGGVGTFQLYAVATDAEGNQKLLGRSYIDTAPVPTTVTVANDTIAKPFGAIDTPAQGATVSGTLNNFGWVLTPDSNTSADGTDILMPVTGTSINVIVDGASVGTATYNLCRGATVNGVPPSGTLCDDDVSSIFRAAGVYRNLDGGRGAIGLRTINTASLSNGLHTIQWGATDSASRGEGIGSRYFTVLNSSADAPTVAARGGQARQDLFAKPVADIEVFGRTGFNPDRSFVRIEAVGDVPSVVVPEVGRVELEIPGAKHVALLANGEARSAPVGLSIDAEAGMVRWSVGPGYLGTYRLSIEREDDQVLVDVTVAPMALVAEPLRMHLDRADVLGPLFTLHGWALDPQAETGSGIGAVHVWARKRGAEVPESRGAEVPVFLGVADLGVARPDVATAHGARFPQAGFSFQGVLPEVGEWEVTAYVWNVRTQRFEDARTILVTVR